MKNFKFIIVSLFVLAISFGFAQKKKVAVVTFYADKTIDLSQVDARADFIAKNTALSNDPDFNLSEPLKNFHEAFFKDYVDEFDFELIPEAKVLQLEAYQNFEPKYTATKTITGEEAYEVIDGYKAIRGGIRLETKNLKSIAEALDADALLFVKLNFRFNRTGIGSLGYYSVQAIVSLDLFTKDNKSIFQFNELAGSKKKAVMVGGIPVMTPAKIQPMCADAVEQLIKDMNKKVTRLAKKANKKL